MNMEGINKDAFFMGKIESYLISQLQREGFLDLETIQKSYQALTGPKGFIDKCTIFEVATYDAEKQQLIIKLKEDVNNG